MNKESKRNCPICGKEILYKSRSWFYQARKLKTRCSNCANKERANRPEQIKLKQESYKGKGNPFFGKVHSKDTIDKANESRKKNVFYQETIKSDSYKEKISKSSSGKNNGMFGKSYYDIWVKKHGKEEADRRQIEKNKKTSEQCRGLGNPMYGKPPPKNSGKGYAGYYNGHFFRSLNELKYIKFLIENNYNWRSAERKEFAICYIDEDGEYRHYFPDFFVNENKIVEVKPKRLMKEKINILKAEAAKIYCKEKNYEYEMIDLGAVKIKELKHLVEIGEVKLANKSQERLNAKKI